MKTSESIQGVVGPRLAEGLEGRLAQQIAGRLLQSTESLPHDVVERLRFAREQALSRARRQPVRTPAQALAPALALYAGGHGTARLGGPPSLWLRLASALPLLVLVAGLVLIQQHHEVEQIHAAAEIDAALLSDAVPPDAYRDPGFGEFLRDAEAP